MELVSILLPIKNEVRYLQECLQSILDQTYHNWEAILVDDHSTDATPTIIEEFIKKDNRFKSFQNEGEGLINALQFGLAKSNGRYITRMDGDDLMLPNRLSDMVEMANQHDHKTIITGYASYFSDKAISEGYQIYESWLNNLQTHNCYWDHIYRESVVASPNWLMHTSTLRKIGGYADIIHPEDYALTLRWYAYGLKIKSTLTHTLRWREHKDRISRTHIGYQQEAFFELKINAFIDNENIKRPLVIWGNNKKSKLAISIFERHQIAFSQMVLDNYSEIEKIENPLLLIAVYPDSNGRELIENYLETIDMKIGRDYWYL
jgi:glycosyltransferase involved in cell wall biosynthesis